MCLLALKHHITDSHLQNIYYYLVGLHVTSQSHLVSGDQVFQNSHTWERSRDKNLDEKQTLKFFRESFENNACTAKIVSVSWGLRVQKNQVRNVKPLFEVLVEDLQYQSTWFQSQQSHLSHFALIRPFSYTQALTSSPPLITCLLEQVLYIKIAKEVYDSCLDNIQYRLCTLAPLRDHFVAKHIFSVGNVLGFLFDLSIVMFQFSSILWHSYHMEVLLCTVPCWSACLQSLKIFLDLVDGVHVFLSSMLLFILILSSVKFFNL